MKGTGSCSLAERFHCVRLSIAAVGDASLVPLPELRRIPRYYRIMQTNAVLSDSRKRGNRTLIFGSRAFFELQKRRVGTVLETTVFAV